MGGHGSRGDPSWVTHERENFTGTRLGRGFARQRA